MNGMWVLQGNAPISTNFYSYTENTYECINHHWGSGVVFHLVQKFTGFEGLSVFYTFLTLISIFFFVKSSSVKLNHKVLFSILIFLTPLLSFRTEVRPEGISALLLGLFLYILNKYDKKEISLKSLYISLFVCQAIWVNMHIFFFMGIMVVVLYIIHLYINKQSIKQLAYLPILLGLATLINPFGLDGALTPLTIFNKYGYMVAENQTVFFMQERIGGFAYSHFEIVALSIFLAGIYFLLKKRQVIISIFFNFSLITVFIILALLVSRAISFFAFAAIPILILLFNGFLSQIKPSKQKSLITITLALSVMLILFGIFIKYSYWSPVQYTTGRGILKNSEGAAKFFTRNNFKGPIFNNYDIGGYLIYHLFPEEKVFVDNRPEAYSVQFFDSIYNPAIELNNKWEDINKTYDFNCIFFYRHDNTTYGQPFLINRIRDKNWAPVYVDDFNIIFLKRSEKNSDLISRFELPAQMFQSIPN